MVPDWPPMVRGPFLFPSSFFPNPISYNTPQTRRVPLLPLATRLFTSLFLHHLFLCSPVHLFPLPPQSFICNLPFLLPLSISDKSPKQEEPHSPHATRPSPVYFILLTSFVPLFSCSSLSPTSPIFHLQPPLPSPPTHI